MTTDEIELSIGQFPLADPLFYERHGYPHEYWEHARQHSPVARIENGPFPYWAVTRHADITAIGRQPELFLNRPRMMIAAIEDFDRPPTIIEMDPPEHGQYRRAISQRFTPRAIRQLHYDIERIAERIVQDLMTRGDEREVDFVEALAAPLPIEVIGSLLGVPKPDWRSLFDWTNRMVGAEDPDFRPDGAEDTDDGKTAIMELFGYFAELLKEKRKHPDEAILSLLSRVEVNGKPLDDLEILAYCLALVVAGNETTRNALSGGMQALIEHPNQLRRLQSDPSLLKSGVEEILRWSSPLIHFARTAARDTELGGAKIRKGDALALFYPSANRDAEVFDQPFEFDVARAPNPHLAFGIGEHFCLGAHLARLELVAAFKHLLPRLEHVDLAGPVSRLRSSFVGGIKRLPIRYQLKSH